MKFKCTDQATATEVRAVLLMPWVLRAHQVGPRPRQSYIWVIIYRAIDSNKEPATGHEKLSR